MFNEINQSIFLFINSLAGQSLLADKIALSFANGAGFALTLIVGLFIIYKERGWQFIWAGFKVFVPVIIAAIYSKVLKALFLSPRPSLLLENVNLLYDHGNFDSFPSSHAMIYATLATSAFFYNKKLGSFAFVGAALISLSRIVVGVHWPIDILVGFVLGMLIAYVSHYFGKKLFKNSKLILSLRNQSRGV